MAAPKTVLYLGTDDGYLASIEKYAQENYPGLELDFIATDVGERLGYLRVFLDILSNPPALIYIDFSSYLKEHIQLARLLKRENSLRHIPLSGLVDKKSEVRGCLAAGADFVHVKCGEYEDVVYDAIFLFNQKLVTPQPYARAKMAKEVNLIDDFRISYISEKGIHAEGNLQVHEGSEITIQHALPKQVISSQRFRVSKIEQTNLYYDASHAYDFDFLYIDKPKGAELSDLEMMIAGCEDAAQKNKLEQRLNSLREKLENEKKDEIAYARKKVKDWVKSNSLDSTPKSTKLLLIDRQLKFISSADRDLDRYPFTLRMQTRLKEGTPEISLLKPSIIAFQYLSYDLEELDEGERESLADDIKKQMEEADQQLAMIFDYLRSCNGSYTPIVMIFNAYGTEVKDLQERFQYPLIILKPGFIELPAMAVVADNFQRNEAQRREKKIKAKIQELKAKDPAKYRTLTPAFFDETRFYVKKSHELSYASTNYEVTLVSLTESEVEFTFEEELDLRTYRLTFPVAMSVRLVEHKDGLPYKDAGEGKKLYHGLIHSIGEEDKMEIRRYINEVFFSPLKEKRQQEQAQFRELNERRLKELQDGDKEPGKG